MPLLSNKFSGKSCWRMIYILSGMILHHCAFQVKICTLYKGIIWNIGFHIHILVLRNLIIKKKKKRLNEHHGNHLWNYSTHMWHRIIPKTRLFYVSNLSVHPIFTATSSCLGGWNLGWEVGNSLDRYLVQCQDLVIFVTLNTSILYSPEICLSCVRC